MKIHSNCIMGLSLIFLLTLLLLQCTALIEFFPIGLTLEYHITHGAYEEWNEQFVIQRWASEDDEDILLVDYYSNKPGTSNGSMYLNINTWNIFFENGSQTSSQLPLPLWINTQSWYNRVTVQIPTISGEYYVSSEHIHLSTGTYSCWRAHSNVFQSLDDDYALTEETWYFQNTYGVLLKHTSELKASQHAIYTYKFTRELIAHNLHIYGIFAEEQTSLIDSIIMVCSLLVIIPMISIIIIIQYNRRRRGRVSML